MQVDALAIHLRPRPMLEAADLGVRLVQEHARSVWRCLAPLWAACTLLMLSTTTIASWLPWAVLFMAKPWLDRSLLFVLSRAVFGEPTRFADLWAARRQVWGTDLLRSLTVQRLSPWRAYTLPLRQLEGQRGEGARQRRVQLLRGRRGVAALVQVVYAHVEVVLVLALFALGLLFMPDEHRGPLMQAFFSDDDLGMQLLSNGCYALVVLALEPFHVASGFALYLNRRVELEAWDIEQEFRHAFGG
ncbi:hypothetical protein [Ideonella sp. BN130291]|uniref:hypothetical protein n=1 Tax=Ideonella sp. BN130291 TaxID=3112940 RepID=UPI002E26585E|nr:hypothetical protein [Ideonella sp. BN130291]